MNALRLQDAFIKWFCILLVTCSLGLTLFGCLGNGAGNDLKLWKKLSFALGFVQDEVQDMLSDYAAYKQQLANGLPVQAKFDFARVGFFFDSIELPSPRPRGDPVPRIPTKDDYLQDAYHDLLDAYSLMMRLNVFMRLTLVAEFSELTLTEDELNDLELQGFTQRITDGTYHVYRDDQEVTTQEVIDEYKKQIDAKIQEGRNELHERFREIERQLPVPNPPR